MSYDSINPLLRPCRFGNNHEQLMDGMWDLWPITGPEGIKRLFFPYWNWMNGCRLNKLILN